MAKTRAPRKPRASTVAAALGRNVRRLRRQQRLRQADLAYLAHITPQAVSKIEKGGANPTLETINAIATALKVDIMILVNRQLFHEATVTRQIAAIQEHRPAGPDAGGARDPGLLKASRSSTPRLKVVQSLGGDD